MDHNLVYAKTVSGERAMLERTRIMPRNVRMVLILVDSQSSVGDLCLKTGNPQLTESALRELEKGGFIEVHAAVDSARRTTPDSLWEEGKKVAQEIRVAAKNKKGLSASFGKVSGPSASARSSAAGVPADEKSPPSVADRFSAPPASEAPNGVYPAASLPDASTSSIANRIKGILSNPAWARSKAGRVSPGDSALPETPSIAPDLAARAYGNVGSPKLSEYSPPSRGKRSKALTAWPLFVFSFFFMLLFAFVLTAQLVPYARYLPELETTLSKACGRPVRVGSLRVELYPMPAFLLGDVHIDDTRGALRIAELRLQAMIVPLISGRVVWRSVLVSGARLPAAVFVALPGIFAELSKWRALDRVDYIGLEKTEISLGELALSDLGGEARRSADGQFQSLILNTQDGHLRFSATPQPKGFDLVLEGVGWRPSTQSPFLFDSINLRGSFEDDALSINSMDLRLFGGSIEGVAILRAGRQPNMAGDVSFKRVNAVQFGDAVGWGLKLSGEAAGTLRFSARSESWATIFSALVADGEFTVQRGSLGGIDLSEAARRASGVPTQGGETKFERFSGKIRLLPSNYRFSELLINSGLMQASGYFDVSPDAKLSGRMELRMHGTVNQTRVPLSIGGVLASPILQLGRGD